MYDAQDICGNLSCNNLVTYGEYLCHQCKTGKQLTVTISKGRNVAQARVPDASHPVCSTVCSNCQYLYDRCRFDVEKDYGRHVLLSNTIEDR